jgi:hypothetical protein
MTIAALEQQATFQPQGTGGGQWDFTNVWTITNGSNTPQIIGLPAAAAPTLPSSGFSLSGTAFTDSGSIGDGSTTVDLVFDGSLFGSTTTDSSGGFSFSNVPSADLTGGLLLVNTGTAGGNTYYQENTASSVGGIDIYGSTLRVIADTASNTALGTTAGNFPGLEYSVNGAALSLHSNFAMQVVSNYTLDGNITVPNAGFVTGAGAVLSGSNNTTITGSLVFLAGTFNTSGSLGITSTGGFVEISGVGNSSVPASTHGLTLNAAGPVIVSNSFLATGGADFTATGTGYTSSTDANGDSNGVQVTSSTIDAQGGNLSLTGSGGYTNNSGAINAGFGVYVSDSTVQTGGAGNIGITGTFNQNIVSQSKVQAVNLFDANDLISAASGTISITGHVLQGTAAGTDQNAATVSGISFGGGTVLKTTAAGGSISLLGDASGGLSQVSGTNFSFSSGIEVGGTFNGLPTVSVVGPNAGVGGTITINGTGGSVDASAFTGASTDRPFSVGAQIDEGAIVTGGAGSTISLTGTENPGTTGINASLTGARINIGASVSITGAGGTVNVTGTTTGATVSTNSTDTTSSPFNEGVEIGAQGTAAPVISVAGTGTITIHGTAGTFDASGSLATGNNESFNPGVILDSGAELQTGTNSHITLTGQGGNVTTTGATTAASAGVAVGDNSAISMDTGGTLSITGTGGAVNAGNGANGADAETDGVRIGSSISLATGGSIAITGTGGALDISQATDSTGETLPSNHGIEIQNSGSISAAGTTTVTFVGNGGNVTAGSNHGVGAFGVQVGDDSGGAPQISTGSGLISITGTGGASPSLGLGVIIFGFSGGSGALTSTSGGIDVTGTGGAGYTGAGTPVGNLVPNYGVAVADNASITTGGAVHLIGTGGANSAGIGLLDLSTDPTLDPTPVVPTISAGGAFTATTLSGTGLSFDANLTAASATMTSAGAVDISHAINNVAGAISISGTSITLNSAITATGGNAVLVASSQFVNNAGANALTASNGNVWQVWSVNPSGSGQGTVDSDGGLTPSYIQYNATHGVTTPLGTGNGLLYSYAPAALVTTLTGTFTKTYDSTLNLTIPANSYTLTSSGLVTGDTISTSGALAGTLNFKDVSTATTVTLNPTQVTLVASHGGIPVFGYTLASASGAATVTPATVTAGLTGTVDKTYDGTTTATLASNNYTLSGVFSGDTVNLNDPVVGAYDTPNAGSGKTVTVSGLAISGASVSDYVLASPTISAAIGTIDAAGVVIAYLTGTITKGYDSTTTAVNLTSANYALSGVVNGDTVFITGPTTGTYASKDVGSGILVTSGTGLSLSGPNAGNYALGDTQASGNIGIITPATLTAALTGTVSKVYDSTTAATVLASNLNLGGLFSGDNVSLGASVAGTYDTKDVGSGKTITVSNLSLSGAQSGDYVLASTTAAGAVGAITPATLTASLTGTVSKVYDRTTTAPLDGTNYSLAGAFLGDQVGLNNPVSGLYDTKDVGTGKTVTVSGLGLVGAQSNDYVLGSTIASGNIGTITAATLTPSLTGSVSKVYDGTTSATLTATNIALNGIITGDDVTATALGTYDTANVGAEKTVTPGTVSLSGADAADYQLSGQPTAAAIGAVTPATLQYVADPVSLAVGAVLPTSFGGSVTGLVNGENLSDVTSGNLVFGTAVTATNNPGSYAIDGSGLTPNNNYTLVQAQGNATALTIAAPQQTATLPSTDTGGAADAGPNLVPPVLTPQPVQVSQQSTTVQPTANNVTGNDSLNGEQPPPFSFTGVGISQVLGQLDGGLANSASNSGQMTTGDVAQMGNGQLNNASNPAASSELNVALGPIVYQNLADALKAMGDWAQVPEESTSTASDKKDEGETILSGGDVAEMTGSGVKNIPLEKAPEQLRNAMNGDVLKGMGSGK